MGGLWHLESVGRSVGCRVEDLRSALGAADGLEQRRGEHGSGGDDALVERDLRAVALLQLGPDLGGREVEVAEVLELSNPEAEGALVSLPHELRTVDPLVRPSES